MDYIQILAIVSPIAAAVTVIIVLLNRKDAVKKGYTDEVIESTTGRNMLLDVRSDLKEVKGDVKDIRAEQHRSELQLASLVIQVENNRSTLEDHSERISVLERMGR